MTQLTDMKEIQNVVLEHILKLRQIEEETANLLEDKLDHLITRLLLRINQNLKGIKGIKGYDVLYDHVENTKGQYEAFILELDAAVPKITEPGVLEIFHGIRHMAAEYIETTPIKNDNPITYERMVLISATVLRIKGVWLEQLKLHHKVTPFGNSISKEQYLSQIQRDVRRFFFDSMIAVSHILKESLELMAAFEEGKKYQRFVKKQVKDIETLVLRQKDIIMAQTMTKSESDMLWQLLEQLTEMHRQCQHVLKEVEEDAALTEDVAAIISMDQMEQLMASYVSEQSPDINQMMSHLSQVMDDSVTTLSEILTRIASEYGEKLTGNLHLAAAEYHRLGVGLGDVFLEGVGALQTDRVYGTEKGKAIAGGIENTVALKCQSIREKNEQYQKDKRSHIARIDKSILAEKERLISDVRTYLEDLLLGQGNACENAYERFLVKCRQLEEKEKKFDLAYMKNDLLFELRTYEELMEHSLKRLIELEPEKAIDVSEAMIDMMKKSRDLLGYHDIKLIVPKEGDKFEAKKHEVLMAETQEGFAKGTIIKCINIGYFRGDIVLVRASVVAAR